MMRRSPPRSSCSPPSTGSPACHLPDDGPVPDEPEENGLDES